MWWVAAFLPSHSKYIQVKKIDNNSLKMNTNLQGEMTVTLDSLQPLTLLNITDPIHKIKNMQRNGTANH